MENKILRLTTSSLFALQGAFAIFWSLYMYLESEANRSVCDRLHFIAVCLVVQF